MKSCRAIPVILLLFAFSSYAQEQQQNRNINSTTRDNIITRDTSSSDKSIKCNGYSEFCSKKYNELAYPGTHNSFAVGDSIASNQNIPVRDQLESGIRFLMFDLHDPNPKNISKVLNDANVNGVAEGIVNSAFQAITDAKNLIKGRSGSSITLCHTSCYLLNAGLFQDTLNIIAAFMKENENEVITVSVENFSNFEIGAVAKDFSKSKVSRYIFNPKNYAKFPDEWPSLKEMVSDDNRLVIFISSNANETEVPWILGQNKFIAETSFENLDSKSFDCKGTFPSSKLTLLNHFKSTEKQIGDFKAYIPKKDSLEQINSEQSILDQANLCAQNNPNFRTNFVAVDYYEKGELFKAITKINNVTFDNSKFRVKSGVSRESKSGVSSKRLLIIQDILSSKWHIASLLIAIASAIA
ncbi:hypothetical protein BB560_003158 [Smittium megazygosporum]|uniref:Uncharacterized protein n=1 Tax=Smittium megazygosporum TaxID=133381 RepID=A0A2T9ZCU0_9FUNG|nr:hypothetical protein BB560_003158 [Smittium megazygosporum]